MRHLHLKHPGGGREDCLRQHDVCEIDTRRGRFSVIAEAGGLCAVWPLGDELILNPGGDRQQDEVLPCGGFAALALGQSFYAASEGEARTFAITACCCQPSGSAPSGSAPVVAAPSGSSPPPAGLPRQLAMMLGGGGGLVPLDPAQLKALVGSGRPNKKFKIVQVRLKPAGGQVRRRVTAEALAAAGSAAAAAAAAARAGRLLPRDPGHDPSPPDAPYSLMAIPGLEPWATGGFLGTRLGDVVRGDVGLAVAGNFGLPLDGLLEACPALLRAQKVLVVAEAPAPEDAVQAAARLGFAAGQVVAHKPRLLPGNTHGSQHAKYFFLEYPGVGVRVVVYTTNTPHAECNHRTTNGLWFQDFPPKAAARRGPAAAPPPALSDFQFQLARFLGHSLGGSASAEVQACRRRAQALVAGHDFSGARGALVASVPGYHSGEELHAFGHMRLRALLRERRFPAAFERGPVVAQASSLGCIHPPWMRAFEESLSAGRSENGGALGLPEDGLRFVWSTVDEVRNSARGWGGGRGMPGTAANLGRPAVRDRLCRFGGGPAGRDRATPHHKSYCRADSAGEALAWVAVGSHNLSGAAWGALQLNGQQLQILSYELSVLMLPDLEAAYRASPSFRFSCTRPADDDVAEADKAPADVAEADVAEAPADVAEVRFVPYRRGRHPGGGGRAEGRTDVAATPGEADARGRRVLRVAVPLPYRVVPLQYGAADAPWACDADYGDARDCHGRRRRGEEEVEMQEAVVAGLARGVAEWARGAAGGGGLG